ERAVAIEMVGRDIEVDRDLWMKSLDRLQLEAGDLENVPSIICGLPDEFDHWGPNIAADHGLLSRMRQNLARKGRRSRLTIRSGDGDDVAAQKARGKFDLADDLDAELAGLDQVGCIHWHAGADNDQVLVAEGAFALAAGLDSNPFVQKLRDE